MANGIGKRLLAILAIAVFLTGAWAVLGATILVRSSNTDTRLYGDVQNLWGSSQRQLSPEAQFEWTETKKETVVEIDPATQTRREVVRNTVQVMTKPVLLDSSSLDVELSLEQRQRGLLWYSTYEVLLSGSFGYKHHEDRAGVLLLTYVFPTSDGSYDRFRFEVDGKVDETVVPTKSDRGNVVQLRVPVTPGQRVPFVLGYATRGLDSWTYDFGDQVSRVKNFRLGLTTNFRDVDFPDGTVSPSIKTETGTGMKMEWKFDNLVSGFRVGVLMPKKMDPGTLASDLSFFAPVSMLFFFAWILVITLLKRIDLHPMNYLFICDALFSFHLLFAYTADRLPIAWAFAMASAVSLGLVISYLRLVVGFAFAGLWAGAAQFVYLVLFSGAHFLRGYAGLVITLGSVATLFAIMQLTGRIRWATVFSPAR